MADSPKQPASPPRGTSPSKAHDRAAGESWDGWHGHGNKDPNGAINSSPTKQPINPESMK